MSVWVNIRSGYCPVRLLSGLANVYRASVHGLLSGRATVFRVSVHRATVCRGYFLGEVSIGLVSGRATVRIPIYRSLDRKMERVVHHVC